MAGFVSCKNMNDFDDSDLENMETLQFTKLLGNGINLGNTFEASGALWGGHEKEPTFYETAWGQPVTTKAMFKAYKDAGFDCVRIPIAWTSTMDWRNGDYKINDDFMNRIHEVVCWALDSGLYVMINDHWDYGWWALFSVDKEKAYKLFDEIWDQVGKAFKDYDYRLFFEAGNEEWGDRFSDEIEIVKDNKEKGNFTVDDNYAMIKELGQHFVDKIRAQGGKNEKRFLVIPGYDTNFEKPCDDRYVMPKDPKNPDVHKLILSVHYYEPALYSIAEEPVDWGGIKQPATTWGTAEEVAEQNGKFKLLQKFTNKGYGVVIGEYAPARLYDKETGTRTRKQNDVDWMKNVLDNSEKYIYAPFLWDCNEYFSKDASKGLGFLDEDVAELYKSYKK